MTIISHLLLTGLIAKTMGLTGNDLIYAYSFGILPDLDHIIKIPSYIKDNGFKIVRRYPWRTFLQEPVMLLPVLIFCYFVGTWVPAIFFSLHLLLDYLVFYEKKPLAPFFQYKYSSLLRNVNDNLKEGVVIAASILGFVIIK